VTADECFDDLETGKRVYEAAMWAFRRTGGVRRDFDKGGFRVIHVNSADDGPAFIGLS